MALNTSRCNYLTSLHFKGLISSGNFLTIRDNDMYHLFQALSLTE